jgi:hypothetical protein
MIPADVDSTQVTENIDSGAQRDFLSKKVVSKLQNITCDVVYAGDIVQCLQSVQDALGTYAYKTLSLLWSSMTEFLNNLVTRFDPITQLEEQTPTFSIDVSSCLSRRTFFCE